MALAVTDNPPELFLCPESQNGHNHSHAPQPVPCSPQIWAKNFGDKPWTAALTNARAEKAVAQTCIARQVPYFLPQKRSYTPGTRNRVYVPLFPGILFFENNEALADIRRAKGVYQLLFTSLQKRLKAELALLAMEDADERTTRTEPRNKGGQGNPQVKVVLPGDNPGNETVALIGQLSDNTENDEGKDGKGGEEADGKVRVVIQTLLFGQPISVRVPLEYVRPT